MIVDEIKGIVEDKDLEYSIERFENEKEYCKVMGWSVKHGRDNPALLFTINNPNNEKNIEIVFLKIDGSWIAENISFGEFDYELFLCADDIRNKEAIEITKLIIENNMYVICVKRAKDGQWMGDAVFYDNELEDQSVADFYDNVQKIKNRKNFIIHRKVKYEFYSWTKYEEIVK